MAESKCLSDKVPSASGRNTPDNRCFQTTDFGRVTIQKSAQLEKGD